MKKENNLLKNFLVYKNIFYLYFFPLSLLVCSVFLYKYSSKSELLFVDLATRYDLPIYGGFFTTLGIFGWVSVFAICLFTKKLLLKKPKKNKFKISFYNYACCLNFILLLDDQFLLHERGGNDIYFYFFYIILLFFLINKLKKIIIENEILYFVLSLSFFSLSIIIDLEILNYIHNNWVNIIIIEDMLKFIGIYYWLIFFVTISLRIINQDNKEISNLDINKCN